MDKVRDKPRTATAVLLQAAEEIRLLGHCALEGGCYDGPMCPIVAIGKATRHSTPLFFEAYNRLQGVIGPDTVIVWNTRQTQASAIATLQKAAFVD